MPAPKRFLPKALLGPGWPFWTLAALLAAAGLLRAGQKLSAFKLAHWHFSYEFEFVKRGLPGELLRQAGLAPSGPTVWLLSNLLFLLVAAALVYCFLRPVLLDREKPGLRLFLLFALCSPATLPHFFWDAGRYDGIGLLCGLCCLALLGRAGPVPRVAGIPLLMTLAVLCHEGAALAYGPLVFLAWAFRNRDEGRSQASLLAGLALLFPALLLLLVAGRMQTLEFAAFAALVEARHGAPLPAAALFVPFDTLGNTVAETLATLFQPRNLYRQLLLIAAAGLPLAFLLRTAFGHLRRAVPDRRMFSRILLLLGAALGPLGLYPLGIDSRRWWALALANLLVVLSLLCERAEFREALAAAFQEKRALVWVALALHLAYGPIEA